MTIMDSMNDGGNKIVSLLWDQGVYVALTALCPARRVGQRQRSETLHEAAEPSGEGGPRRGSDGKGGQGRDPAVHQVRGRGQENGRHQGPLQGRGHEQERQSHSDGEAQPADGQDDGSESASTNG